MLGPHGLPLRSILHFFPPLAAASAQFVLETTLAPLALLSATSAIWTSGSLLLPCVRSMTLYAGRDHALVHKTTGCTHAASGRVHTALPPVAASCVMLLAIVLVIVLSKRVRHSDSTLSLTRPNDSSNAQAACYADRA